MNNPKPANTKAAYRRYILVAILVIAFGYALFDLTSSSSDQVTAEVPAAVNPVNPESKATEVVNRSIGYSKMPITSLDHVVTACPFTFDGTHTQSPISQAVAESRDTDVDGPLNDDLDDAEDDEDSEDSMMVDSDATVDMILETSRGRVAKVGNYLFREGSAIGGGVVVQRINSDRIVLEKLDDQGDSDDQGDQ